MFAFRPSIGWVVYLFVGKSWFRMCSMLLLLSCLTLTLLRRSEESLLLQYTRPSHFPPPLIILPNPKQTALNAFDACAVEAAIRPNLVPRNYNFDKKPTPVYVYMWDNDVPPRDFWTKTVAELSGVKLAFMDMQKVLKKSPISPEFLSGGWKGKPSWAVWMAFGGSLVWLSGGILMPSGVIPTSPLYLDTVEENTGLLIGEKVGVSHVAYGAKPHHNLTKTILETVQNYKPDQYSTSRLDNSSGGGFGPLDDVLTRAVGKSCGVSSLQHMFASETCNEFTTLNSSVVWKFDFETPANKKPCDDCLFLQYTGEPNMMSESPRATYHLFKKHGFKKYCPLISRLLEKVIIDSL